MSGKFTNARQYRIARAVEPGTLKSARLGIWFGSPLMSALCQKQTTLVRAKAGFWLPREARSNKSGSIVVKISEEQFHFCELGQASRRLPPTSAQVLGERREQTL